MVERVRGVTRRPGPPNALMTVGRVRGFATQSFTVLDGDKGWRQRGGDSGGRKVGHGGLPG